MPFFYGWMVLAVAALGIFMSGPAQTFGVAVFIDPILAEFGWSRSLISGSYAIATVSAGCGMLVFGHLLDRVGARRAVTVLAILYGAGCIAMSAIAGPLGLIVGFMSLRVLGASALTLSCSTLAAIWFVRLRGRAVSITVLGGALSNVIMPPALQWLVGAYGWRTAWVIVGVFIWVGLVVPAWMLLRDRPEAVGMHPDGQAPVTHGAAGARALPDEDWTLKQAARTRTFWLLVIATLAPGCVQTGLVFHQVSFFAARGFSAELAALVLSLLAVSFALTTIVVGQVLERVSTRSVLIAGLIMLAIAVAWLMVTVHPIQAMLYGVLLGAAGGIHATTSGVLWPVYYGRRYLGSIRGVTQGAIAISAALGPLILSVPLDVLGSYALGLWIMFAMSLACAVAALLAGPPQAPAPVGATLGAARPGRPEPRVG